MRSAALIALLPFLATFAAAAPSPHTGDVQHTRKSLSFGPKHHHAVFETLEVDAVPEIGLNQFVDPKDVARRFIAQKLGSEDAFYIRPDTYTDRSTGVTHVYAKQLLHGLEVSDGDMNLNIDAHGRVLSWGNSFHKGPATFPVPDALTQSTETSHICTTLTNTIDAQQAELATKQGATGAWGLVKAAAHVFLPGLADDKPKADDHEVAKIKKHIHKAQQHYDAICSKPVAEPAVLYPVDALLHLLPRLQPESGLDSSISADELSSTPEHMFTPKPAPNEPPTETISGPGLAKAGVVSNVPARMMYTQTSDGDARLVWKFEVEMKDNWYEAYVDASTGDLLRIVDWANDYTWNTAAPKDGGKVEAFKGGKQKPLPSPPKKSKPYSYQVFPWGINDPTTGNLTTLTEPWDKTASPHGWHQVPSKDNIWAGQHLPGMNVTQNTTTFYTTVGNNVIAHEDWEGQNNYLLNYRPVSGNLSFVYDYGEPDGLAPKEYIDFVVTQLFYTSNMYHDLTYRLGFDELAGNFQLSNGDKGGRGGDPVIANAQDGSGYNNANFMTPPDGTSGRMRMYVWDTATPYRDGDIEAGIVIHELSHGLSTRITGGPANSGCLGYGEAGGMGEGWGDALATLIRQIEEHKLFSNGTDLFSMGAWAANREQGIRNYVYSTNSTINPSTYKTLDKPGYWGVHAIGEVWAEILFSVSQRLVEKYGFSTTLFPPEDTSKPNDYYTKTVDESFDEFGKPTPLIPKHGNTLAMQLIIDGLKLQPCRPSFFDARDAIIQADQIRTGGANACLIWKAFAERGLGSDASVIGQTPWGGGIRNDGYKIPSKVCKK